MVAAGCLAHPVPSVPSHALGEERTGPSLAPCADRPELPRVMACDTAARPGSEPCSSRVVGGAGLVSLPSLSGPKPGCIWVSLGGAGPARARRGERGGDDSIFQVFGVSELRSFQPLTALPPGGTAALAEGWAFGVGGVGWGRGSFQPESHPPRLANHVWRTMWRSPQASPSPNSGFPKAHAPRAAGSRPRKRALEQFTDARVPGLPFR